VVIRPLTPGDASAFRALRIRALIDHPEAPGRTREEVDSADVTTVDTRARALYASYGFESVAIKPRSLRSATGTTTRS
jgi:hypothetical protein